MRNKMFVFVFVLVSALIFTSCTSAPICVDCHTPQAAVSSTPTGLCGDWAKQGFVGPIGSTFGVGSDETTGTLRWNASEGKLTSDDGLVNINVPEGTEVTPKSWPEEFAFLKGTTFVNCNGFLLLKLPDMVHILED